MRQRFENKYWAMTLAFMALISVVLLSGTLRTLDFRPAQPIGNGSRAVEAEVSELPTIGQILADAIETPFWKQVVFWVAILLLLLLVTSLLNPELRRQLIYAFIRTAIIISGLIYVFKKNPDILAGIFNRLSISENLAFASQGPDVPVPVFEPPRVSNWFTYAVAFGFVLLMVLFFRWLNRIWKNFRELSSTHQPLDQIAAIARASMKDLEDGKDSENAIIRCYDRMSAVVDSKQGLHRGSSMTPSEFAIRLEHSGLPRDAVSRLTRLFESVRYGAQVTGPRENDEAISCLTSIIKYCGESSE